MRKTHKSVEILAGNGLPGKNNRAPSTLKGQLYLDYISGRLYRSTETGENALWELFLPDFPTDDEVKSTVGWVVDAAGRLDRFRDVAIGARSRNPIELPVMASPPTIAASTTNPDGALTNGYTFWGNPGSFDLIGGYPVAFAGSYVRGAVVTLPTGTGNADTSLNACRWAIEFYTDAPKMVVHWTASSTEGIHFQVDDEFVSATPTPYAATTGNGYFSLDFSGVRKTRRIRMWAERATAFYRAYVDTASKVWADNGDRVKVAFLGDSIAAAASSANVPQQFGLLMGWQDVRQIAVGGTGFVNPGTNNSRFGDASRLADMKAFGPDVIVAMTTPNDANQPGLQAAVLAALNLWRTNFPNATIILTGMFPGSNAASAIHIAAEATSLAAFNQFNDKNSYWIPVISDPAGSWVTGTGRVGATTGVGNADIYVQDGTHPSVAGYAYFARRLAIEVRRKVLRVA